jgi:predicted  nucleic acid-binding Zn-ribbon protein
VLNHEHFEEICAAAVIGQASPTELEELELHALDCGVCRQAFAAYLELVARQYAGTNPPELSPEEAESCLNSESLARRFFARAEREGIVFSRHVAQEPVGGNPLALSFRHKSGWHIPVLAAAAAGLIIALSVAYFAQRRELHHIAAALNSHQAEKPAALASAKALEQRIADLKASNLQFAAQLQLLSTKLNRDDAELAKSDAALRSASEDRQQMAAERETLASEREALRAQVNGLQQKLADSQAAVVSAQQQLAEISTRDTATEASLISATARIHDLTEELNAKSAALDQERQLLAMGHDVSNMMAARNLHIVDVVDSDPRGKRRPAFGRIFFTEGKSLVFYAYDLNEAKIETANYHYRVWAMKEGQDKQIRSLGIFYSDDKAQRRWVFKCDDPKVLAEIDSVFVTLEPANGDSLHPKGTNLMYAYLRGQANHP